MPEAPLELRDIYLARRSIQDVVMRTPLRRSASLSRLAGASVYLKLECEQAIGAFKIRGASNRIAAMSPAERERGVVTVSTGNHGRGVASAAERLGVRAVVCMSNLVPENKRAAIREAGAELRIVGASQDDAEVEAKRLVEELGMTLVHPFDDPLVIAGQGTIGIELLEDLPEIDALIAGLSGGGLIAGIALALKAASPRIRVIGVSMERGAAMIESLAAGRPVAVEEVESLADSLGGGIGLDNAHTFRLVRELVDETYKLSEAQIAEGMRYLYREEGIAAEGAGAIGVAALLAGALEARGGKVAVIISGKNVDPSLFESVMSGSHGTG